MKDERTKKRTYYFILFPRRPFLGTTRPTRRTPPPPRPSGLRVINIFEVGDTTVIVTSARQNQISPWLLLFLYIVRRSEECFRIRPSQVTTFSRSFSRHTSKTHVIQKNTTQSVTYIFNNVTKSRLFRSRISFRIPLHNIIIHNINILYVFFIRNQLYLVIT